MNSYRLVPVFALVLVTGTYAAKPKETVFVTMRDGIRLATDVYRPEEPGRLPVILARTPYNKEGLRGIGTEGAKRGFVVVAQDVRGRFGSEGENLPFNLDGSDGHETIEWVAKQSWCNGRIGTWGGSALAITQFQLMASGTDKIAAQHLTVGAPDLYDVVYIRGVFRKSLVEDWLRFTQWSSNALPLWVSHSTYDDYWRERDATRHFAKANAPAVHIGGYWDIFAQATIDGFLGYQRSGGPKARGQQKLILGPWAHAVMQEDVGELQFPNGKRPPGEAHDAWKWFDRTLKNETTNTDSEPAVTYYVIGDVSDGSAPGNRWRTAAEWPPVRATDTPFYFQHNRSLSTSAPGTDAAFEYVYDPQQLVPTVGGIQLSIPAGPKDQRAVESRSDVLIFTSEPLNQPVEVTGRVKMKLWVSADVADTDFIGRLCDVYPDGRSFNLCEGALRMRFRDSRENPTLIEPGRVYPIELDLWSTSVIFNTGHRIRVHVTSSSSPGYDPNPNTGAALRSGPETTPARITVYADSQRASRVILPVASER